MDNHLTLTASVAEEIRGVMGKRNVNKAELARRLHRSDPWVGRRLSGATAIDFDDLEKIASVLEVPVSDLLPMSSARYPDVAGPEAFERAA